MSKPVLVDFICRACLHDCEWDGTRWDYAETEEGSVIVRCAECANRLSPKEAGAILSVAEEIKEQGNG